MFQNVSIVYFNLLFLLLFGTFWYTLGTSRTPDQKFAEVGEDSIRCVRILNKSLVLNCTGYATLCHIDSHLLPKKAVHMLMLFNVIACLHVPFIFVLTALTHHAWVITACTGEVQKEKGYSTIFSGLWKKHSSERPVGTFYTPYCNTCCNTTCSIEVSWKRYF
jgi:hypothetical protein